MYTLREEKITGSIKVLKGNEYKTIERKVINDVLKSEAEKECDEVRRRDYEELRNALMGIEALLLDKHSIQLVFSFEAKLRKEGEAIVTKNKRLLRILGDIHANPPRPEKRRTS